MDIGTVLNFQVFELWRWMCIYSGSMLDFDVATQFSKWIFLMQPHNKIPCSQHEHTDWRTDKGICNPPLHSVAEYKKCIFFSKNTKNTSFWKQVSFESSQRESVFGSLHSPVAPAVIHPSLCVGFTCARLQNAFVFICIWQTFTSLRHKCTRSVASLLFLSAVLSIIHCYSNTVKLNFKVFHLPNPAALPCSHLWSCCGWQTEPKRTQCDWWISAMSV